MNDGSQTAFIKLRSALESKPLPDRYKGIDPFDGLNSPLMTNSILGRSRVVRLVFIQFFKRSIINLRSLFGIKAVENPQALGIFLKAYCVIYRQSEKQEDLDQIIYLADRIIELQEKGWSGACWSYPFAWQARAFYQPRNTPLIVPTAYCVNGLLDAYDITENKTYLDVAVSTREFILKDLNRTVKEGKIAFSYSPYDRSVVYNASLMATQILSRIYTYTKEEDLAELAKKSVDYAVNAQNEDGSWAYGEAKYHQWVDSFHSGYNLVCLNDYKQHLGDKAVEAALEKGLKYYLSNMFEANGFARYFNKKRYPLDMNNPSQLVITLNNFNLLDNYANLTSTVWRFTINNMQAKSGWFYYQKHSFFTNKIIYLRWSNAWAFYALALLKYHDS